MQAKDTQQNKPTFIKRFLEWIKVKERVHFSGSNLPQFKEGEIWWVYIGDNVGSEINGKGQKFTRPVLVYKKFGHKSFFAIPLSTKQKEGTWFVNFEYKGVQESAVLCQARVLATERLNSKIGQLDEGTFNTIKSRFVQLYK